MKQLKKTMAVPFSSCLLIFGILISMDAGTFVKEAAPGRRYNVGYQVLDFEYQTGGQSKMLTVAVWYPTAAQPKRHTYGGPTGGNVAVDAAPLADGGPYPLLVFSHGYGGSGIGSVFFTAALASRGWIVACPDHHDRFSAVRIRTGQVKDFDRRGLMRHAREIAESGPEDRGRYLYRLDEIKLALDGILASVPLGKLADQSRIAVGGHSFGGFTALGLCGTIRERHDPRIKAVLLFSTGAGGYLFRENELRIVQIPLMLLMGEREREQMRGSKNMAELSEKIYKNASPPKYFAEIKGASHFSFNNGFADTLGSRLLSGTEKQFDVIRRYSIAFLEKHAAGRNGNGDTLERSDPMLTRYIKEPSAGAAK
jgi:predicted dienelactone hydrolase